MFQPMRVSETATVKHRLHTGQARLYWQWASPEGHPPRARTESSPEGQNPPWTRSISDSPLGAKNPLRARFPLTWGPSPMSEDRILPRGAKSRMSEVHIRSSSGSQQSPQSEVLILSKPKLHGYHINQLWMGQNIEVTETVNPWGKVWPVLEALPPLPKFIEIDHNCHTTLQGMVDW